VDGGEDISLDGAPLVNGLTDDVDDAAEGSIKADIFAPARNKKSYNFN